jgi:FixJ family two-component response regulator
MKSEAVDFLTKPIEDTRLISVAELVQLAA